MLDPCFSGFLQQLFSWATTCANHGQGEKRYIYSASASLCHGHHVLQLVLVTISKDAAATNLLPQLLKDGQPEVRSCQLRSVHIVHGILKDVWGGLMMTNDNNIWRYWVHSSSSEKHGSARCKAQGWHWLQAWQSFPKRFLDWEWILVAPKATFFRWNFYKIPQRSGMWQGLEDLGNHLMLWQIALLCWLVQATCPPRLVEIYFLHFCLWVGTC